MNRIKKWGNSLGVHIPKIIAQKAGFSEGTPVEIETKENCIIIRRKQDTLQELMSKVTPDNIHGEVDTGSPVGREEW